MNFKKILTSLCFIVPLLLIVIYFSVGDTTVNNTITADEKAYEVYLLAFEQGGFTGTYDEWLADISGDEIEVRVLDTKLQWKYCSEAESEWRDLYELSNLKGADGNDGTDGNDGETGAQGEQGLSAFDVWLTIKNDSTLTEEDFFASLNVYNLWLAQGNNGSVDEFLSSLKGEAGAQGETGEVKIEVLYDIYVSFGYQGTQSDFETAYEAGTLGNLKQEYTVTFVYSDDVSENIKELTFDGDLVKTPNVSLEEKRGYEFAGWFYEGKEWLFDFYVVKQDITLEATYEIIEYKINYNLMGGVNSFENVSSYTIEDYNVLLLHEPTKYGSTFIEWQLNDVTFAGLTEDDLADITLVAIWEEYTITTYDVVFSDNGNEILLNVNHGDKLEQPADPIAPSGYEFIGWYVGDEKWSFIGYTVTSNITLVAKFAEIETVNEYTITYNVYGIVYIVETVSHGEKLNAPAEPTVNSGYVFDGWYVDGERWSFVGYTVTSDLVLVANIIPVEYEITYTNVYANENSFANKTHFTIENTGYNAIVLYPAFSNEGFEFVEWRLNDENGDVISEIDGAYYTAEVVLYAVWDSVQYSVFYYFDNSYVVSSFSYGNDTSLPTTFDEKEHYTAVQFNNKLIDNEVVKELSLDLMVGNSIHLDVTFELTVYYDDEYDMSYVMLSSDEDDFSRWNIHAEEGNVYTLVSGFIVTNCKTSEVSNYFSNNFLENFTDLELEKIIDGSCGIFTTTQYEEKKDYYNEVANNENVLVLDGTLTKYISSFSGNYSNTLSMSSYNVIATMQITK